MLCVRIEEWGLLPNKLLHKQTVDLLNKKSIDVYDDNPSWIFKTAVIVHKCMCLIF